MIAKTSDLASGLSLMVFSLAAIAAPQVMERVESPAQTADGQEARQLTERARLCIAQLVSNETVVARDTARVNPMASVPTMTAGDSTALEGGEVLQSVDLDSGVIVAQSRIRMGALMPVVIQSTITFEARPGRFRISHSAIRRAFLSSGYSGSSGFTPVYVQPGSSHQKIEAALQDLSSKISACVVDAKSDNW